MEVCRELRHQGPRAHSEDATALLGDDSTRLRGLKSCFSPWMFCEDCPSLPQCKLSIPRHLAWSPEQHGDSDRHFWALCQQKSQKKKKKKTHEALSFRHSSVRNDTNKTQPIDQNPKQNSCPSCCSDLWWGWSWNDPQEGSCSSTWHDSLVYEVGQTRGS